MDIGHLTHVNGSDISKTMDDLNKLDSFKLLQQVIKDAKEGTRYKSYYTRMCDLLGYKSDLDNTEMGFMFAELAGRMGKKENKDEEFD